MKAEIVPLKEDHLWSLYEFTKNLSEESLWYSRFKRRLSIREIFDQVYQPSNEEAYVILNNSEKIVAYGHLELFPQEYKSHVCKLGVVVADEYQGKGLGREMVAHLIKRASELGKKKMWLSVQEENRKAINLYRSLGFDFEGHFIMEEKYKDKYQNVLSMAKFL